MNQHEQLKSETTLTGVSMIAIALGVAVMTISVMVVTGFKNEIEKKVVGFGSDIRITEFGSNESYTEAPINSSDIVQRLTGMPEIKHVQAYASKAGIIKTETEIMGIVLKGVDNGYDFSFLKKHLKQGRLPKLVDADSDVSKEMMLSAQVASALRLKTNDTITVYFIEDPPRVRKMLVSGIYHTGLGEFDKLYAYCDIDLVRKLNNWSPKEAGGVEVLLKPGANTATMLDQIHSKVGYSYQASSIQEIYPQIFNWLELQNTNVVIIIALILAVSGVSMISTLLIIILNRTRMIAVLKSLGAKNSLIRNVFIRLSLPVVVKGMVIGNFIGIGLCWLQEQYGLIKLSEESYYVSKVPVNISLVDLAILNAGTLVICIIMLIGPSLIIAGIRPSKTLRFD